MTHLQNLTMQLQYGVQNYGENDPLVQELKREIEELQQLSPGSQRRTQDDSESGLLSFHVGFRKKQG